MTNMANLIAFVFVALAMAVTPGPNMIYLLSRTICQGRMAGMISLGGVAAAFLLYMACAALGITALILAVPFAYDALCIAGALYLLYLAWQAIRPGARSPLTPRTLAPDSPRKLLTMGFVTSLLNPKTAVFYLSLLPQFVDPAHGNVLGQSMLLGAVQILVSFSVNTAVIFSAGGIAAFLARKPIWADVQRWIMASLFAGLAVRMATDARR